MSSEVSEKISVLVPSYNHARFVERCLRSIFGQTLRPAGLLVIDDGSTDDSVDVIEKVLADCPFPAELIVNQNRGLCATLNEGLSKTKGEYFAYLGSDDLWFPEFLRTRVGLLERRNSAVLAYGNAYLIDESDRIFECTADWKNFSFPDGDPRPMLYIGTAPVSSSVCYRRSALEKRGWNENARLEDYELYLLLAEDGDFAFDDDILAAWRRHGANTSRDLDFMLTECLNAQIRAAGKLGWPEKKLSSVNKKTRFFYAGEFDRAGNKKMARSLLFSNLGGAGSWTLLLRSLIRIFVPAWLLDKRKRTIRAQKIKEYGNAADRS